MLCSLLFPLTYLGGRLWLRCETLSLLEIDFFSGSRECVDLPHSSFARADGPHARSNDETPVEKPQTPFKRFLKALV